MPNDLGESEDFRTAEQTRYDALCDLLKRSMEQTERAEGLILNLAESVQNGTHQTVVYKHEGAGTVAIVSAAVAVLCVLFVIGGAIVMDGEITRSEARVDGRLRDLEAWRGVHATKIQNLENLQKGTGK